MQTLAEKKLARTEGGRASFAVLLFQDVAAVPLLALMPLLALGAAPPAEAGCTAPRRSSDVAAWTRAALVLGAGGGGDPGRALPDPAGLPLPRAGRGCRRSRSPAALLLIVGDRR